MTNRRLSRALNLMEADARNLGRIEHETPDDASAIADVKKLIWQDRERIRQLFAEKDENIDFFRDQLQRRVAELKEVSRG